MWLEKGEFLVKQGDSADAAFLIEDGSVEILLDSANGRRVLAVLGPGEIVGEMALVDGSTRTASVRAREACRVLPITSDQVDKRVGAADPILRLILTTVLERFRATLKTLENGQPTSHVSINKEVKAAAAQHLRSVKEFELALERGQILIYYQPIVELTTGLTVSFEALARWQHPYRGLIQPSHFVPMAEANGLSTALALHCLREVQRDILALGDAMACVPHVSMNISGQDLASDAFSEALQSFPRDTERRITLELTETSLVSNPTTAALMLEKVRQLGFRIAIDDFGTGHSSLNYVRTLPVDTLKIDKAFVQGASHCATTHSIIVSMVQLANSLQLDTIAEGIETAADLDAVTALGCKYGQGYLFGRPAPLDDVLACLAARQETADAEGSDRDAA